MRLPKPPIYEISSSFDTENIEKVEESDKMVEENSDQDSDDDQSIDQPVTAFDILMSSKARKK